ncbi:hypothetical protein ADK64_36600 [Streptomyces sp. MMG1121]|nr:hypothetical protein ADK64_36600 [Streptomyces sp. MMG1121]
MIALGVILLIVGFLLHIGILWTIGIILLVVGLILLLLGSLGHAVGGRRHHWWAAPPAAAERNLPTQKTVGGTACRASRPPRPVPTGRLAGPPALMAGVGCIQAQRRHPDNCPTGVTPQDPR